MHVFVTGATGTIGGAVAAALLARGHTVLGLARSDASASRLEARGIAVHRGDLADPASLAAGARAADATVHAAAPGPDVPVERMMALIGGSQSALLEALEGSGKALIATSGVGAYGDTGPRVVDESDPLDASPRMAGFGRSEQAILAAAERGVRSVVLRPAIVYGGRGRGPVDGLMHFARQLGAAPVAGEGANEIATVHAEDLADLYALALERSGGGEVYNGVAEPFVRSSELAEAIAHAAGLNGAVRSLTPSEITELMGPFLGHFVIDDVRVSGAKARRTLGWSPSRPSLLEHLRNAAASPDPSRGSASSPTGA